MLDERFSSSFDMSALQLAHVCAKSFRKAKFTVRRTCCEVIDHQQNVLQYVCCEIKTS